MNASSTSPTSDDLDEAPIWEEKDFAQAVHRLGLRPAQKKVKINITLDPDVIAWFKHEAGGRGYQTLINAALREAMTQQSMETLLRRVVREELASRNGA